MRKSAWPIKGAVGPYLAKTRVSCAVFPFLQIYRGRLGVAGHGHPEPKVVGKALIIIYVCYGVGAKMMIYLPTLIDRFAGNW